MEAGFKELQCEPKKAGKKTDGQRFDLGHKHINLKKATENTAATINVLLSDLEKQFMDDPEFQKEIPQANSTAANDANDTNLLGGTGSLLGSSSPKRGTQDAGKTKKAGQPAQEPEPEIEKTEESKEFAAFRNQRLGTPRMNRLVNKKDGGFMLKD